MYAKITSQEKTMATAKNERPIPSGEGLTFEKMWAIIQENDRKFREKMEESDRKFREEREESDRKFREEREESDRKFQKEREITDRKIGALSNRFGELAEHLVAPSIMEKFNEIGFFFTRKSQDIEITEPGNPNTYMEIDFLLENGDIAIAVEVKAKPKQKDVDDFVLKMEKLRCRADKRNDKRHYRGAIAGAIMGKAVRDYAIGKGLYVIEQTGDTVRINIPKGFTPKDW
jgi:hypothetical protein